MSRILTWMLTAAALVWPVMLHAQTNVAIPLPSLQTLLSHAADAANREDYYQQMINSRYTYERSRVNETKTSNGKVLDHSVKKNTNAPVLNIALRPLPPFHVPTPEEAAAAKQNRKQLIDVTELVTNVLADSHMTIMGRETVNGRSTIVVDFQPPEQKIPEDNLMDRLVNRATGRAWVDEEDYTLARLKTHLTDKLTLFAGFGAVLTGNYFFDRERTPEGVWYSKEISYDASIREFIFYRTMTYHERYTNVSRPVVSPLVSTTR